MGWFKDVAQFIKNDPWIPLSKKRPEPAAKAPVRSARIEKKDNSFCSPQSTKPCITVCAPGSGCECGCGAVKTALEAEISKRKLGLTVGKLKTGCSGSCKRGPFIGFPQKGFFYLGVKPEDASAIVSETLMGGKILFNLISINPDRSYRSDIYFEKETGLLAAIDDQVSMVEVAKYFLDYGEGLSCGKCVPCRIGIKRLHEAIQRIAAGEGTTDDLEEAQLLCETMVDAPHCELAASSSEPVFSALKYFGDEFKAVVKVVEKKEAPEKPAASAKAKEKPKPASAPEAAAAPAETPVPVAVEEPKAEAVEEAKTEAPVKEEPLKVVAESIPEAKISEPAAAPEEPVTKAEEVAVESAGEEPEAVVAEAAPAVSEEPVKEEEIAVEAPEAEAPGEAAEVAQAVEAEAPAVAPAVEESDEVAAVAPASETAPEVESETPAASAEAAPDESAVPVADAAAEKKAAEKEKAPKKKKKGASSAKSKKR